MSDERAKDRVELAWSVALLAIAGHVGRNEQPAMRKLVRAYGKACFEQGRARESQVQAERDVDRLSEEFERRRYLREVPS